MDPFGLPNDASLYACNDGSVPPIIASFVLSARRPDGTPFVIERVFDPCNLGTPVGGGAVESFHHCDPLFVDVFRCGFLPVPEARFGETVLESGPYLYLESLTMLGIDESTQYPDTLVSLGLPDLDPVIVHSEDLGFFGNVDNVHASRRDYYVEVAFLTPDKELVAPTPPTVSPSCPAVGEEIGHGEYCCGDGFWDPGEQCDDGNTSPGDGCDAACDVEPGGAPADADQDGVPDANDQCAGTPAAQVDAAGCSRPQFCAAQDASTAVGKRSCKKSDWTNDEPLLKQKEADCIVNNLGTRDKTDDLCAPS
jgi:cysteine-rich repeat protein